MARAATHKKALSTDRVTNRVGQGSNEYKKATVRNGPCGHAQEMTLDCFIFRCSLQSRVISVLSYYLTSLVNLSFCRLDFAFSDRIDFGIFSIHHIICVILILHTEISSLIRALSPALTRYIFLRTSFWFSAVLVWRFLRLCYYQPSRFFVFPICFFLYIHSAMYTLPWALGFYLYIGITSCVYKIAYPDRNFNMGYCINWLKTI